MLANGSTIGYAADASTAPSTFTNIPDLKALPDIGAEPELVDNTALSDSIRRNEQGIGDPGEMEFVFRYNNANAQSSYRVARALSGVKWFQVKLFDGTTYTFKAIPACRLSGGGVNDPVEFVMSLALQSDITIADPSATPSS